MNKSPEKGTARPPTEDEKFYRQWGYETIKSNISTANDVLRLLITLNTALLGGSAAFLHDSSIGPVARTILLTFFFIALLIALLGIYPKEKKIDIRIPEEVKIHKKETLNKKRTFLKLASSFTLLGLLTAIISVIGIPICP